MPKIELLTPIVPAGLHDDAGIIGGAALRAPAGERLVPVRTTSHT